MRCKAVLSRCVAAVLLVCGARCFAWSGTATASLRREPQHSLRPATNCFAMRSSTNRRKPSLQDEPVQLYSKRKLVRDASGLPVVRVRADRSNPIGNFRTSQLDKRLPRLQGVSNDQIKQKKGLAITRIVGGSRRGLKLFSPSVFLRPMMSKVKEALFSMLTSLYFFRNKASSVLDLYAGAGSVALESISRGAGSAVCVDFSDDCVSTIRQNAQKAGFSDQITTVQARVEDFLTAPDKYGIDPNDIPFSLITITPPYQEVVYADLIQQVARSKVVGNKTIVVFEYPSEIGYLPPTLDGGRLIGVRNRKHGRTMLGIYVRGPITTTVITPHPEEFGDEDGRPLDLRKKQSVKKQHTSEQVAGPAD